jgi:hypothetical protein
LITVYATSAEPLSAAPSLYVVKPGLAQYAVRMVKTGTYTYKVTIRLKSTGRTGTMSLRVKGIDAKGGINQSILGLPLH